MRQIERQIFGPLLVAIVDCLIVFDAFSIAYLLRFHYQLAPSYHPPAPPVEYLKAMVVVAYFWIILLKLYGLYDFSRIRSSIDIVYLIFRAISFGTVIILSLSYFYREFTYSRLVCVYAWAISLLLFTVFRLAIQRFQMQRHRDGQGVQRVLLIGSRGLAVFLVDRVREQPGMGYRVVGTLDDGPPSEQLSCRVLGRVGDLERVVREEGVDRVLLAHPALGHRQLLRVIHTCEQLEKPLGMVPPTYDLLINYRDLQEIDGIPIVAVNEREKRKVYEAVKRVVDVVLAAAGLVVLAPLWIVLALLIWLEDGGPVFFSQPRVGRDGAVFKIFKFRTMVVNAEALLPTLVDVRSLSEPVFKLDADPRVTRVGRFLRRSSLDEIPQLINVLRGDMSLVGPRPEERAVVERYGIWERRRLKAKPGLTGLQQVQCRGSTRMKERVRWDILYLRKQSLLLDFWILLKTVYVVLSGQGAR